MQGGEACKGHTEIPFFFFLLLVRVQGLLIADFLKKSVQLFEKSCNCQTVSPLVFSQLRTDPVGNATLILGDSTLTFSFSLTLTFLMFE